MKKRKYPLSMFLIGFIGNIVFRLFWLFIPAVILIIIGIFVKTCLYIGLFVLAIDVIASFIELLIVRRTLINNSDNSDFTEFQDALFRDENWVENIKEYTEEQINKQQEPDET